jgi:predicted ferric reductase
MRNLEQEHNELSELEPVMALKSVIILFLAIIMGTLMAAVLLPNWMPGLSASLLGPDPTVYWYLSRGTAFVSFGLLWLSMILGVMISNKLARLWPGGPVAFDLHQYASLLGLGFAIFHGLILLGDQYIGYSLTQILVPFASSSFMPFWVGLGQIGIYLWALVAFSFYIRRQIGTKSWRLIHFFSFVSFALAMIHGIVSGTDSGLLWATRMYWFAGSSLMFLIIFRIFVNPRLFPKKVAEIKQ